MKTFSGTIIGNKSMNTVNVLVEYVVAHKKYGKLMKRRTKLLANNLLENVAMGDIVVIESCRPLSKNKFFQVKKIIGNSKVSAKTVDIEKEIEAKPEKVATKKVIKTVAKTEKTKKVVKKKS